MEDEKVDLDRRGSAPPALKRNVSEASDHSKENKARSNSLVGSKGGPITRLSSMK